MSSELGEAAVVAGTREAPGAGEAGEAEEAGGPHAAGEMDDVLADADGDADADADLAGAGEEELLGFTPVRFVDVSVVLPSTNPVVVLEELGSPRRRLRIPVGQAEGVAIAYAAKQVATPKPLTHELFVSALEAFGLTLEHVRVTEVHKASFSAELVLSGPWGTRTLACRPSDGIALALRQQLGAPIVVAPHVLDEAGELPAET